MNKFKTFSLMVGLLLVSSVSAYSATTPWMSADALRSYVSSKMGKAIYATKIECRVRDGKLEARFHTKPVGAKKPFYKWQFVIAKKGQLQAAVNKIPRPDRKDLVYQVKSTSDMGEYGVCAIAYR